MSSGVSLNGTMPAWAERADGNPLLAFVDSCLRGVGQVCFMNNPVTGLAILVAMFVAEAWLGFAGALGARRLDAARRSLIGMDRGAIRAGLFGFNGVLVGAGLSLFLQPDWDVLVMVWIVVGAALLARSCTPRWPTCSSARLKVPPFTLAFNFMTLIFLIGALNFANGRVGGLIAPADAQVTGGTAVSNTLRSAADAGDGEQPRGRRSTRSSAGSASCSSPTASWAGIIIVVGIAVVLADRGDLRARRLDGRHAHRARARRQRRGDLQRPVGLQLVRRRAGRRRRVLRAQLRSGILAVACAVFAALLFGAIASLFIPWGLPALTLPFCFATLAFVLLKGAVDELEPVEVEDITTPEEHLARARGEHAEAPRRDAVAGA